MFLFIWFSNLIGYIPLPTNTEHPFDLLRLRDPDVRDLAATANISIPLALALIVWVAYNVEGVRAKGAGGYLKSLIPAASRARWRRSSSSWSSSRTSCA